LTSSSPLSGAALVERLIQAAVDYEQGRCSSRDLSEARTAVEAAIPALAQPAPEHELARHKRIEVAKDAILRCPSFADIMSPPSLCAGDMAEAVVDALAAQPPAAPVDTKTVYVKRWRTLVNLPAKYADEIVDALRPHNGSSAATEEVEQLRRQLQIAKDQRNAWQKVAGQAGVCMTCAMGAPDPYGCTDCLNTGWEQGAPHGYMPIPTEPQTLPVTQNAAVLAERLIQTAVDYESGRCGKREMAEARAAVEAAIGPGSVK
jgi:hypothetical protein